MEKLTPAHLTIMRRALMAHRDFLTRARRYGSEAVDKEIDLTFDLEEWVEGDEMCTHFGVTEQVPDSTTQGQ